MEGNSPYITNLVNSIIGVSVLAMPFCLKQCGIILGLGLLFAAAGLTYLSCSMLVTSAFHKRRRTYEYLALYTLGPTGKFTVELSMIGMMLGTCVAFYVVIGDLSNGTLSKFIEGADPHMLRVFTIVFSALCIALPLGMMKNLSVLSYFGMCSLIFYLAFLVVVILNAISNGLFRWEWWREVTLFRPAGIFQCLPIFSLAYACHCQLFIVYNSLEDPSVRRIEDIVASAIKFVTVMYMSIGFFGYTTYREHIAGNLLVSFPSNLLLDFIKLGFAMSVVLGFPLMIFPCRQSIHTLFFGKPAGEGLQPNTYIPPFLFKTITLAIVLSTMTIAIVIPNVETILGLTGATMGSIICFIFPALIYDRASPKGSGSISKFVFAIGCLLLVVCTYSNLANTGQKTEIPQEHPVVPADPGVPDIGIRNVNSNIANGHKKNEEVGKKEPDEPPDKDKPPVVAEVIDDEHRHEPANPIDPAVDKDESPDLAEKPINAAKTQDEKEKPGGADNEEQDRHDSPKGDSNIQPSPASKEEEEAKMVPVDRDSPQRNEDVQAPSQKTLPPQKVNSPLEVKDSPKKEEEGEEGFPPENRAPDSINQHKHPDLRKPAPVGQDTHPIGIKLPPKVIHPDEGHLKQEVPEQPVKGEGERLDTGQGGIEPENQQGKGSPKVDEPVKEEEKKDKDSPAEKELLEKIKIQHDKQQELLKEQEQLIKKLEEHHDKKEQAGEEDPDSNAPSEKPQEEAKPREREVQLNIGDIVKDHFFAEAPVSPKNDIVNEGRNPKADLLKQGVLGDNKVLPRRELLFEQNVNAVAPQNVAPVPHVKIQDAVRLAMSQNNAVSQETFVKPELKEIPRGRQERALEEEQVEEMERKTPEEKKEVKEAEEETAENNQDFEEKKQSPPDDEFKRKADIDPDEKSEDEVQEIENSNENEKPEDNQRPQQENTQPDVKAKLEGSEKIHDEDYKDCLESDTDCWQGKSKSRELKSLEQNDL